jgi:hypothetical protein
MSEHVDQVAGASSVPAHKRPIVITRNSHPALFTAMNLIGVLVHARLEPFWDYEGVDKPHPDYPEEFEVDAGRRQLFDLNELLSGFKRKHLVSFCKGVVVGRHSFELAMDGLLDEVSDRIRSGGRS